MTNEQYQHRLAKTIQQNTPEYNKYLASLTPPELDLEYMYCRELLVLGQSSWHPQLDCLIVERNRRLSVAPSIR